MRQLLSTADLKAFSLIVGVVLLLSSAPLTSGVVLVSGPSQPEFTVNICQPVQAFNCASNILLARPAVNAPQFVLFSLSSLTLKAPARIVERDVPPDTPPPKSLALAPF